MVVVLKIFLAILSVAFGYITHFITSEFKKFKKSEQSADDSLIEKFIIGTMAFSCIALLIILAVFCVIMICSSIVIILPF